MTYNSGDYFSIPTEKKILQANDYALDFHHWASRPLVTYLGLPEIQNNFSSNVVGPAKAIPVPRR